MTPLGTFERVYAVLKQRLREGHYKPGTRLEPAVLSDELNASVTPVRDALHRLVGERLVEAPPHEGFRVPMMTETQLRHLYAWHFDLLQLAVLKHQTGASADARTSKEEGDDAPVRLDALFLALARASGNPEHAAALEGLSCRLEPLQRLEQYFLDETQTETAEIVRALQAGDRRSLRNALLRYHRRRLQIVPKLLARLLEP